MNRKIVGFSVDDAGDRIAMLDCLHHRHVRHRPPFEVRPWVLDDAERAQRIGTEIDCGLCERSELPEGLSLVRTAGPFDSSSLPPGLRRSHRTAAGIWAVLSVLYGEIRLQMGERPELLLAKGASQAIPPGVVHSVTLGAVASVSLELWGQARRDEEPVQ
ncbi:MAG: DUF3565 domain-containing protein [Acidimicrobiales bacterium]